MNTKNAGVYISLGIIGFGVGLLAGAGAIALANQIKKRKQMVEVEEPEQIEQKLVNRKEVSYEPETQEEDEVLEEDPIEAEIKKLQAKYPVTDMTIALIRGNILTVEEAEKDIIEALGEQRGATAGGVDYTTYYDGLTLDEIDEQALPLELEGWDVTMDQPEMADGELYNNVIYYAADGVFVNAKTVPEGLMTMVDYPDAVVERVDEIALDKGGSVAWVKNTNEGYVTKVSITHEEGVYNER